MSSRRPSATTTSSRSTGPRRARSCACSRPRATAARYGQVPCRRYRAGHVRSTVARLACRSVDRSMAGPSRSSDRTCRASASAARVHPPAHRHAVRHDVPDAGSQRAPVLRDPGRAVRGLPPAVHRSGAHRPARPRRGPLRLRDRERSRRPGAGLVERRLSAPPRRRAGRRDGPRATRCSREPEGEARGAGPSSMTPPPSRP